jgi:hypothetical protein
MEFVDTYWLASKCSACYRVRGWNPAGEGTSAEACGTAGDPWPHTLAPPVLRSGLVFDWGVQLEWTAEVPAGGQYTVLFFVNHNNWSNWHSWEIASPGTGSVFYITNIPWAWLTDEFPASATVSLSLALNNDCHITDFSNAKSVKLPGSQSTPPSDPPPPPPPSDPPPGEAKPDLRFKFSPGIYLGDRPSENTLVVPNPEPNEPVGVFWDDYNASTVTTVDFVDTLGIDGTAFWQLSGGPLSPNGSDRQWIWLPSGFSAGTHWLKVYLDSGNDVDELFEHNNDLEIGIDVGW